MQFSRKHNNYFELNKPHLYLSFCYFTAINFGKFVSDISVFIRKILSLLIEKKRNIGSLVVEKYCL